MSSKAPMSSYPTITAERDEHTAQAPTLGYLKLLPSVWARPESGQHGAALPGARGLTTLAVVFQQWLKE